KMDPLPCDSKKPSVQIIVERTRDSITEIFTKYRQKLGSETRLAIERSTNIGHNIVRSPQSNCNNQEYRKGLDFEEKLACFLLLIIVLILLLVIYLVRRYNHSSAYGSGGCLSTVFWTFDECQILT
ncbi:hypothetical protein KR009_003274, partial [Drosophila setifemur]